MPSPVATFYTYALLYAPHIVGEYCAVVRAQPAEGIPPIKGADRWNKFTVLELQALLWQLDRSNPPRASIVDELGTEIDVALRRRGRVEFWPLEVRP